MRCIDTGPYHFLDEPRGGLIFQNFALCDFATRRSGYASATARRAPIVSAAS
jgi:hypothetical protein